MGPLLCFAGVPIYLHSGNYCLVFKVIFNVSINPPSPTIPEQTAISFHLSVISTYHTGGLQ